VANWHRVANIADCPRGHCLELAVGERIIALFNVDGMFYALDGICPHQGGPLGEGELEGSVITCPWHGWQFDVRTGCHQLNRSLVQPSFGTKVEAGWVFVEIPDAKPEEATHVAD
jgi:nitrite reductase/ring-hydroxylating ferredoxin subunit